MLRGGKWVWLRVPSVLLVIVSLLSLPVAATPDSSTTGIGMTEIAPASGVEQILLVALQTEGVRIVRSEAGLERRVEPGRVTNVHLVRPAGRGDWRASPAPSMATAHAREVALVGVVELRL